MSRRAVILAAGVVLVAPLVACANVPTSGQLEIGDEAEKVEGDSPPLNVNVPLPEAGASQLEIVDGFLDAMFVYEPGYPTAQAYLTKDAQAIWDPAAEVKITSGQPARRQDGNREVILSYTLVGTVNDDGSYMAASGDEEVTLTLSDVTGEWRIDEPPDGIIMTEQNFERFFKPYNRYFFDPSFKYLVPDPVYLPLSAATPTMLAQALLRGPSKWLEPAVETAFPTGTQLAVNSVTKDGSTAAVELNEDAADAPDDQRRYMAAQLAWTMSELTGIVEVDATAAGGSLYGSEPLAVANLDRFAPAELTRNSPLYALGDSGVITLGDSGEPRPVDGVLGQTPGLRGLAVNPLSSQAAAVDESGERIVTARMYPRTELETLYVGTQVSSLSWDSQGLIWAVDADSSGSTVVAMTQQGDLVDVSITGLDGRSVDALRVSPDGTRLAVVIDGAAYIGVVVRGSGEIGPIKVHSLRSVGPEANVLDVGWIDGTDVVLLIEGDEANTARPVRAGLTRDVIDLHRPVDDGVSLAIAPLREIVVETTDGELLRPEWTHLGDGRLATYPG